MPRGAFDSQTNSQEWVEGIFEAAGQSPNSKPFIHSEFAPILMNFQSVPQRDESPETLQPAVRAQSPHTGLLLRCVEAEEELERVRGELKRTKLSLSHANRERKNGAALQSKDRLLLHRHRNRFASRKIH
jgi:hypothetical protein